MSQPDVDVAPDAGAVTTDDSAPAAEYDGRRIRWSRVLVYAVLPTLVVLLTALCGMLKWQVSAARDSVDAAAESLQSARDSTVELLSYTPETVERDLTAARDRTTGAFRDSYAKMTNEVVIPGSKEKLISATAKIPAATSVSADANHAVALVFVDQTITMGADPPVESASSVRVTLDKVGDRWLVSGFDPV